MPIRPENRKRYPANWKDITQAIRDRAGGCCEGSPAYPDCRAENGQPHPITGSRVVLTVAHLDHTPENCEPSNLRAWCQRCHITYDAPRKAEERKARAALSARLVELEPDRPLVLAAHLNGTPSLTDLAQLTAGEVQAMLKRLALPTYALASWQAAQVQPERDGAAWLR